ncbi:MAG: hypothetical protein JSS78_06755 [Bacteroidetes bacterium]|nr:hypothetical protein [Bacteroidota bacterium]
MIRTDSMDYVVVVATKSEGDDSDENKQKNKYAVEHFATLNEQLAEEGINQTYLFHFLSPSN